MPRVLDIEEQRDCSLRAAIEALTDLDFDPNCQERLQTAAQWLKRLSNNRTFLADMLVDQLTGQANPNAVNNAYSPQAIMLCPHKTGRTGGMFLRANIWPAEQDLCFQTSGAKSFVYGVPHDHDFSFLTAGYCGPGYRSDYFEYDYENVAGYPGERVDLRFVERSALSEGKVMLYRAHRDIHSQLPPEALSVSLNVMHVDPAQSWLDQYGFDLERKTVSGVLSPNSTEAFMRVAVAVGTDEALEYAEWVGKTHPSDRLRQASFEARAALLRDAADQDALWRLGEQSGSRLVAAAAKQRRAALAI